MRYVLKLHAQVVIIAECTFSPILYNHAGIPKGVGHTVPRQTHNVR